MDAHCTLLRNEELKTLEATVANKKISATTAKTSKTFRRRQTQLFWNSTLASGFEENYTPSI